MLLKEVFDSYMTVSGDDRSAAHLQRLDLIVATAALLDYQYYTIYLIPDGHYGPMLDPPWWYCAYHFLRERGLFVAQDLTIEPYDPHTPHH